MNYSYRLGFRTLLASLAVTSLSSLSFAQSECMSDTDCDQGFLCQQTSSSGCAVPSCAPGEPCPDIAPCEPMETYSCVKAPCQIDSDCDAGMVCQHETQVEGSASGCAPGADCEPTMETHEVEFTQCVPKWALPCEAASDCGEGFDCVAQEMCACNSTDPAQPNPGTEPGSAPPGEAPPAAIDGGSAGGAALPAPPSDLVAPTDAGANIPSKPECECETVSACVAKEVECEADSDCPTDWTCVAENTSPCAMPPVATDPTEPPPDEPTMSPVTPSFDAGPSSGSGGSTGAEMRPADDGASLDLVAPCEMTMAMAKKMCMPPYSNEFNPRPGIPTAGEDGSSPDDPTTGPMPNVPPQSADAGKGEEPAPQPPTEPAATDHNGNSGPTAPGNVADSGATDEDNGSNPVTSDTPEKDEGCSVAQTGHSSAPTSAAWLLAAGFGAMFARRRRGAR